MRTVTFAMLIVTLLSPLPVCGRQDNPTPTVGLHLAALQGNVEAVRQHIKAESDLNEKDPYGSTALIIAATFGRTEVARALIEAGADLNIPNNDGGTALHTAALLCRTEIVEALLDRGADRHARDGAGNTPFLSVAAPFEDLKGLYDLLAQGLGPLGLQLDYEEIRRTRPQIAEMLRPLPEELEGVEYTPLPRDDWAVSTPTEQGLDPDVWFRNVEHAAADRIGHETVRYVSEINKYFIAYKMSLDILKQRGVELPEVLSE